MSTVPPAIKKSAEELLKKLDDFVLFRQGKDYDRPTVKPKGNVVSGELKQVGISPRQGYVVTTREKFNEDAKKIVKRRQNIDYSNFDEFRHDLHQIAMMEVIELEDGNIEIFCNCFSVQSQSGSKGDICVHVCARYCNVLYCTVLYCTVLNCILLYCTVLYLLFDSCWLYCGFNGIYPI